MRLTLPLKRKWFDMTKSGAKTEEYREINDHWCRRLLEFEDVIEWQCWEEMIHDLNRSVDTQDVLDRFGATMKTFDTTVLTLGYPAREDHSRRIEFENEGVEIGFGNPDWGAEKGKRYFIINHGRKI